MDKKQNKEKRRRRETGFIPANYIYIFFYRKRTIAKHWHCSSQGLKHNLRCKWDYLSAIMVRKKPKSDALATYNLPRMKLLQRMRLRIKEKVL